MSEFDGKGFSQEPFDEEERAEIRHHLFYLKRNFLSPEEFLRKTGLGWASKLGQAAPGVGLAVALAGTALTVARWGGWL